MVAEFEGKPGVFISGAIKPALSGVSITISVEDKAVSSLVTDANGKYK